ncbi:MAG: hypothetical protein V1810_02275 [Candidatus Beckwithbacteria bacterium]
MTRMRELPQLPTELAGKEITESPFPSTGFILMAHTCNNKQVEIIYVPFLSGSNFQLIEQLARSTIECLTYNQTLTCHGCGNNFEAFYVFLAPYNQVKLAYNAWLDRQKIPNR